MLRRWVLGTSGSADKSSAPKKTHWEIFRKPSVISVFLLVILWNISVSSSLFTRLIEGPGVIRETAREIRDINLHLQLRFYQLLTLLRPIPFQPNYVSLAYIDDDVHWSTLYGIQPTSREFLARLITNASQTENKAAAIGIDIELLAPRHFPVGTDAQVRFSENQALFNAIQFATHQGVPVVLAGVYYIDEHDQHIELPNIFTLQDLLGPANPDCNLARCPSVGFINLPGDKRAIPLEVNLLSADTAKPETLDSFALSLAKAVKGPIEIRRNPLLAGMNLREGVIYGTFLPEEQYPEISVVNLANGQKDAMLACAGRVLLIGGRWHDLQGFGGPVDQHLSPAGYLSGLGLHANYLESLLQHQFTYEVPLWVGILIDLLVGLIIYRSFEVADESWWRKLVILLGAFLIPIVCAFLFLDLANVYLDFLLPTELYFLHILYEIVERHLDIHSKPVNKTQPIVAAK
jgi:CHASE2 domain-containing sensor protein